MSKHFAFAPYSPSRMETIICPEQFRSKYMLKRKVPQDNRGPLDKGLTIHTIFEKIMNARIGGTNLNINDLDAWISETVAEYPAAFEYIHDVIRPASINFMSRPSMDFPFFDEIEEAEKVFAVDEFGRECDYDDPNCFARAVLDLYARSGDHGILIDHKSQLNVEKSDTRKMLFYAWIACRTDPSLKKVSMILHFCHPSLNFFQRPVEISRADLITSYVVVDSQTKKKLETKASQVFSQEIAENNGHPTSDARMYLRKMIKDVGRVVDVPFYWVISGSDYSEKRMRSEGLIKDNEYVMDRLDEEGGFIESEIVTEAKYIEAFRAREGVWKTVPHSKCEYCPSYYDCPARKTADEAKARAGVKKPESPQEAAKLLEEMFVFEDQVSDLRKTLKDYLKSEKTLVPSVVAGDREFTTRLYHAPDFNHDPVSVKVWLKKMGQNPEDFMKFESKPLNKFIAGVEDPKDVMEIRKVAPVKTSTKTQAYKL